MAIVLDGTSGITNDSGYTGDGVSFADSTPANTLVTTSGGNVGIGTSSPGVRLEVNGGSANTEVRFTHADNVAGRTVTLRMSSTGAPGGFAGGGAYVQAIQGAGIDNYSLAFGASLNSATATERMRIDFNGNLLVGATSATFGSQTGMVQAGGWIVPRSTAVPTGGVGGATLIARERVYFGDNTGWTWDWFTVNTSGTTFRRFFYTDAGAAFNATGTWGSISDAKLKENIVDATPKLEKLNQVRVVNYNLIGEEHKQLGVIAQELEQIFPGMVEETVDKDAEGNDLGTTTKAVKYSVFVPMLIKAIQEQQAIITALTARVEALEGAQA